MSSDADKSMKISVDMSTTGQPAVNQAGASLKSLKIDTSDLTDETKRALNILPPLEDGLKKGGKAAEEAGISHRELRKVLLDIGNVAAPGAGRALAEIAFGPVGAALALVTAYESLKEKLDEIDKKLEDLNNAEFSQHQAAIEAVKKAWADAKQAILDYDQAVKDAGEDKDPAGARLKQIQAVSAAETAAQLQQLENQQKYTLEWMKTHGFTPEQIGAEEEAHRRTVDAVKDAAANKSVTDIQHDIDTRKERQSDYDDARTGAAFMVEQATNALKQAQKDKNDATDVSKIEELNKTIAGIQAMIIPDVEGDPFAGISDEKKAELEKAQAELARMKASSDAADAAIDKATADLKSAQDASDRAKSAGTENKSRVTQEEQEVKTQTAVNTITQASEAATRAADAATDAVDRTAKKDPNAVITAGATASDDIEAMRQQGFSVAKIIADFKQAIVDQHTPGAFTEVDQQAIARYQKLAQDQQAVRELNDLMVSLGQMGFQMIDIIRNHQKTLTDQASEIAALQTAYAQLSFQHTQNQFNGK